MASTPTSPVYQMENITNMNLCYAQQVNDIFQNTYYIFRENFKISEIIGLPENFQYALCREKEINTLIVMLEKSNRLIISGLGGIGKTTLAVTIVRIMTTDKKLINHSIFLNCENEISFEESLRNALTCFNIKKDIRLCEAFKALCKEVENKNILFIYDNVDDCSVIQDYLPNKDKNNLKVIITSQDQNLDSDFLNYSLETLDNEKSEVFIQDKFSKYKISVDSMNKIIDTCDGYPLLLNIIISCVIEEFTKKLNKLNIDDIIKRYIDNLDKKLTKNPPKNFRERYRFSVQNAISINLEKVEKDCIEKGIDRNVFLKIRNVFMFCNPDEILVSSITKNLADNNVTDETINEILSSFDRYYIISINEYNFNSDTKIISCSIHKIAQLVLCNIFEKSDGISALCEWMKFNESHRSCTILEIKEVCKEVILKCTEKEWKQFSKTIINIPIATRCINNIFKTLEDNLTDEKIIRYSNILCKSISSIGNVYVYDKFIRTLPGIKAILENIIEEQNSSIEEWESEIQKLVFPNLRTDRPISYCYFLNVNLKNWIDIFWLCWWGRIDDLEQYEDEYLSSTNIEGWTIYHVAAMCDQIKLFQKRSKNKSYFNTQTKNGNTPLHIAILYSCENKINMKVIKFLFEHADLNIKNDLGYTVLHYAVLIDLPQVVKMLIKTKPSLINVKNLIGNTALHMAVICTFADIVKILLTNGASIQARNMEDKTPLEINVRDLNEASLEIFKILIVEYKIRYNTIYTKTRYLEEIETAYSLLKEGLHMNNSTPNVNPRLKQIVIAKIKYLLKHNPNLA